MDCVDFCANIDDYFAENVEMNGGVNSSKKTEILHHLEKQAAFKAKLAEQKTRYLKNKLDQAEHEKAEVKVALASYQTKLE
mmetsp:Transcript_19746/g.44839  ORF Transcript_19746/g.44839 Transcript_19746/m.44839 type:complete len:81 (+) Transcript_19746:144-386(+)